MNEKQFFILTRELTNYFALLYCLIFYALFELTGNSLDWLWGFLMVCMAIILRIDTRQRIKNADKAK